jgi:hypothetical protein
MRQVHAPIHARAPARLRRRTAARWPQPPHLRGVGLLPGAHCAGACVAVRFGCGTAAAPATPAIRCRLDTGLRPTPGPAGRGAGVPSLDAAWTGAANRAAPADGGSLRRWAAARWMSARDSRLHARAARCRRAEAQPCVEAMRRWPAAPAQPLSRVRRAAEQPAAAHRQPGAAPQLHLGSNAGADLAAGCEACLALPGAVRAWRCEAEAHGRCALPCAQAAERALPETSASSAAAAAARRAVPHADLSLCPPQHGAAPPSLGVTCAAPPARRAREQHACTAAVPAPDGAASLRRCVGPECGAGARRRRAAARLRRSRPDASRTACETWPPTPPRHDAPSPDSCGTRRCTVRHGAAAAAAAHRGRCHRLGACIRPGPSTPSSSLFLHLTHSSPSLSPLSPAPS